MDCMFEKVNKMHFIIEFGLKQEKVDGKVDCELKWRHAKSLNEK